MLIFLVVFFVWGIIGVLNYVHFCHHKEHTAEHTTTSHILNFFAFGPIVWVFMAALFVYSLIHH